MREIKFRAWDAELDFMVNPSAYFVEFDGSVWFNNTDDTGDELYDQSSKLVLMQYTGLKDKNGVEIYESDIVKHKNGWTGVVAWNQEDCSFISENVKDRIDTAWLSPDIQTVIGNIHQNPELLKGE